jgi:hypothetical protein
MIKDEVQEFLSACGEIGDKASIIFNVSGDGVSSAIATLHFLMRLEEELNRNQQNPMRLSVPVDSFVGCGTGALGAAACALDMGLSELKTALMNAKYKRLGGSSSLHNLFSCAQVTADLTLGAVSQYRDKSIDTKAQRSISHYDALQTGHNPALIQMYGARTTAELRTLFEVFSSTRSQNILESILQAIHEKDTNAAIALWKDKVGDLVGTLHDLLSVGADVIPGCQTQALEAAKQLNVIRDALHGGQNSSLQSVISLLKLPEAERHLSKHLFLVDVAAEVSSSLCPIPHCSFASSDTVDGKLICSVNYKVVLPEDRLFNRADRRNLFVAAEHAVECFFPIDSLAMSSAQMITLFLVQLLQACGKQAMATLGSAKSRKSIPRMPSIALTPTVAVETTPAPVATTVKQTPPAPAQKTRTNPPSVQVTPAPISATQQVVPVAIPEPAKVKQGTKAVVARAPAPPQPPENTTEFQFQKEEIQNDDAKISETTDQISAPARVAQANVHTGEEAGPEVMSESPSFNSLVRQVFQLMEPNADVPVNKPGASSVEAIGSNITGEPVDFQTPIPESSIAGNTKILHSAPSEANEFAELAAKIKNLNKPHGRNRPSVTGIGRKSSRFDISHTHELSQLLERRQSLNFYNLG